MVRLQAFPSETFVDYDLHIKTVKDALNEVNIKHSDHREILQGNVMHRVKVNDLDFNEAISELQQHI